MSPFIESLQSQFALGLMRLPLSWVTMLSGPARTVDGYVLDTRMQWLLKLVTSSGRPQLHELPVDRARAELAAMMEMMGGSPPPVGPIVERSIPGPAGRIGLRLYRPSGTLPEGPQRPILVYYHGGGWVVGSAAAYDKPCRYLCAKSGCIVVSVDYRLAPEHKFAAAVEDAVAAFLWVAENAASLGGDPAHIAVGGDSAGGNLAAVVAQQRRGQPGPQPAFQLLIYPATDLSFSHPSHESCGRDFLLTRPMMEWFRAHYLNGPADIDDPRASPLRATDFSHLPPAFVATAGFDPLRDEGKAYAERLQDAGVPTVYRNFEGLIHGFVAFTGVVSAAARALDEIAYGLRQGLGSD